MVMFFLIFLSSYFLHIFVTVCPSPSLLSFTPYILSALSSTTFFTCLIPRNFFSKNLQNLINVNGGNKNYTGCEKYVQAHPRLPLKQIYFIKWI